MAVSEYGMEMLRLLDDYAVGGSSVTPATESYQDLQHKRVALRSLNDWMNMEAIHLNPARKSLEAAYKSIHCTEPLPTRFSDRAVVLDFDNYSKDGLVIKDLAKTPEELLVQMQNEGVPMPYCCVESHTPGNFHFIWIYRFPKPRDITVRTLREVYSYWGADVKYTNSTMRNPIFTEAHHPDKVRWWNEWTTEVPLLDQLEDLIPTTFFETPKQEKVHSGRTPRPPSNKGLFSHGMSLGSLEQTMQNAVDGQGRWHLLKSWVSRHITKRFQERDAPFSAADIRNLVSQGNEILKQPMEARRVHLMASWWTSERQESYGRRQINAGEGNRVGQQQHQESVVRYYDIVETKRCLELFLEFGEEYLPEEYRARDLTFVGRKRTSRGVTNKYVAHLLNIQGTEEIDSTTGEILSEVTGESKVKNTLHNGHNLEYRQEDFVYYVVSQDLTSSLHSVRLKERLDRLVIEEVIPQERLINVSSYFTPQATQATSTTGKRITCLPYVSVSRSFIPGEYCDDTYADETPGRVHPERLSSSPTFFD